MIRRIAKGEGNMIKNEQLYRRTVSSVGFAMLFFLLLLEIYGAFVTLLLPFLLSLIFTDGSVAYSVAYELIYAAGYLASFMIPVLLLKRLMKHHAAGYRPIMSSVRISPYLPLLLVCALAVIFSMATVNSYFMDAVGYFDSPFMQDAYATDEPTLHGLILEFIVICLVPGLCEEFLFRGAVMTNLLPYGKTNAILISALLFSLMHRNGAQLLYAFAAGILFGLIYEKTGSIWNCVFLHTVNNFVSCTEGTILYRIREEILANTVLSIFEVVIFLLGAVGAAVLFMFFFQKKDAHVANGFFGRSLPIGDGYAEYPIAQGRAVRLFMAPTMVIYLCLCTVQALLLILLAAVM